MSDSDMGGSDFISHPNTRTLHRGTRTDGPDCGQAGDSWAEVDAETPLEAVLDYATPPCTKCINHVGPLNALYKIDHSAFRIYQEKSEIISQLPWEDPREQDTGTTQTDKNRNQGT